MTSITPAGKTLIPVVRQLEQWGNEFRPAMKKILGMEDGRILHAAFCRARFSTTSSPLKSDTNFRIENPEELNDGFTIC